MLAGPGEVVPGLVVHVDGRVPGGRPVVAAVPRGLTCEVWDTSVYWPGVSACNCVLVS